MSIFSKKDKRSDKSKLPEIPELPKLPSLGDFNMNSEINKPTQKKSMDETYPLPSFPSNDFGDKFSQETIKGAVKGNQNIIHEDHEEEVHEEIPMSPPQVHRKQWAIEKKPIFVQIDKFEESLDIFRDTQEKMHDIEELLHETKKLKEQENEELSAWEMELQQIKKQIEKVDSNLFSKI